jgi:hypothetical protein
MTLRTFRDSAGLDWRVWEVHPQWTERRSGERRAMSDSDGATPERRKLPGRRWGSPDSEPRVRVREGYEKGWLAFESPAGKRRLGPIPAEWEAATDAQLELLCRSADAVRGGARGRHLP